MGRRPVYKPIDRSNIRTSTIVRRSDGSSYIVRREATESEKDAVVERSRRSRSSSKTTPQIIKAGLNSISSGETSQTAKLEVNQTSQQQTTSQSQVLNPNISSKQFQARLVTQAPQGTVFDGGVNQGTQEINNIPQFNILRQEPPPKTYSARFEKTYDPSGFGFLRIDKYFDDLYKKSNVGAIKRQPDGSFVASQINPTKAGVSFVAGVGRSVTYPLFNPIETIKGGVIAVTNPVQTAQAVKQEAQTNPFGFAGEIVGGTKGINLLTKGVIKVKDYSRTIGRKELPRTDITTPEVITGEQTFPYKVQTPEELVKEFSGQSKQIRNIQKLYGDEQPIGFSASPDPLKGFKILGRAEIGDFTSASSGLYQAPSLSEWFLKIRKGESPKYSLLPNFRGKPTINLVKSTDVRTFPKDVVSKARKSSNPTEYLNKYAEQNFKQGESFVTPEFTLGKPESEILLKAGTEFKVVESTTGSKYFVNIEGRRVPVSAIEPTTTQNIFTTGKTKTSAQINKEFSESSRAFTSSNRNALTDFTTGGIFSQNSGSSNKIVTTGNVPNPSSAFSSITSTTAFNPSSIYPTIEVSGVIKPSSYRPPQTQKPSSIFPTYDLEPIRYPITRPDPSPRPSPRTPERRRSTTPTPPKPSDFLITPSETTGGGGGSSTPPIITTPSRIITPPPSRVRTPPITNTRIITTANPFGLRPKRQKTQGFDVLVRRKGKFFKENPQPLTKQSAINFGTFTVGSDSSATFKLRSVFGKPTTFLKSGNIQNFYKKGNLFIEKKEKRIKRTSPLELQQITFKGIATNRVRSKKIKNIFGGGL